MNKLKRNACLLAITSAVLLATVSPFVRVMAQAHAPAITSSTLVVPGIKQKTTIRRDDRGIAYIEAANESDLYFAQGFATANDRLFQMDLLRRTARGELSEIFGKLALDQDKRWRRYGFAQLVQQQLEKSSPAARAMLDAYAQGVNAYVASLAANSLPPEFAILGYRPRPWEPTDSLAVMKIFADALSTSWDTDIMRASLADLPAAKRAMLLPEVSDLDVLVVGKDDAQKMKPPPLGDPLVKNRIVAPTVAATVDPHDLAAAIQLRADSLMQVGVYAEDRAASNNWVVSGKRTESGKPFLANDPHLQPSAPGVWHLVNLNAPGLHVAGVTMPGLPGVIIGHNDRIAWGATNLGPDVQDLFIEKFDPRDPHRYQTAAGWRDAEIRIEQIKVRKSFSDPATESVPYEVTVTRHGPIFFESNGARYALRWPALDPDTGEVEALYRLTHARNWSDFTAGLSRYGGATQNFIYADVDGNIGYYGAGHIPLRRSGDGSLPNDGATDAGDWTGYIPFAELPHSYNPPNGMIVTANQRVVGNSYAHFLTHEWAQPFRARRITELLQGNPKLTSDDFRDVQRDVYSIFVSDFVRELIKLADAHPAFGGDQDWTEAVALFRGWDGRLTADSRAAFLASQMIGVFSRKIMTAALGPERAKSFGWSSQNVLLRRLIVERPADWLPAGYSDYLSLLRDCVKEARTAAAQLYGADPARWTWGAYRVAEFPHPLGRIPLIGGPFLIPEFPLNGGSTTVNVGSYVSMRFIADLSDWDKTRHGLPLGESGLPASPHWKDQLDQWRSGNTAEFPFSPAAVERATKEILTMTPKGR